MAHYPNDEQPFSFLFIYSTFYEERGQEKISFQIYILKKYPLHNMWENANNSQNYKSSNTENKINNWMNK